MDTFIYEAFVCSDCNTSNFEQDIPVDSDGDYVVECGSCGGAHIFGNIYEDKKYAAYDAYNDMVRGK